MNVEGISYKIIIASKIKEYEIPPELVLNSDQTPSSYISVGKSTMALRGSKAIPIKGITDKRAITLTFVITLSNDFLPMQVIYCGKTKAGQPRVFKFPSWILHHSKSSALVKRTRNHEAVRGNHCSICC